MTSRFSLLALAVVLALRSVSVVAVTGDVLDRTIQLDIKQNTSLESALIEWGAQTGVTVMINTTTVSNQVAAGISGKFEARQALAILLKDSGLSYSEDGLRISIVPIKKQTNSSFRATSLRGIDSDVAATEYSDGETVAQPVNNSDGDRVGSEHLSEVIVTAQKREEKISDVPIPMTSISAETLINNNQVRIQDYFSTIPGLNFTTDGNGAPVLSVRGVTTGFANPTMGITIDDVPYGSSSGYGGVFAALPDIDPSDLSQIEVLRGPQGTLYGASSLGGLLKFVTVAPSPTQFSARVETDVSSVKNAVNLGYGFRASANIPVTDSMAMRVSAFARGTPGYIDDVLDGQRGTNRVEAEGAHWAFLLRPSDTWSLSLSALYQNQQGYGMQYVVPSLGDLKQSDPPNTGTYQSEVQAYSAIFKVKLGEAELTSLSGYNVNNLRDYLDDTYFFAGATEPAFNLPLGSVGTVEPDYERTSKFSEEIRLAMPITHKVDWLLGVFYTYEKSRANQQAWAASLQTGGIIPGDNVFNNIWPSTFAEYAIFTNVTVHFTDNFNVQFGARESQNRQTYSEVDGGDYTEFFGLPGAPAPLVTPEVDTKDNSFTYLVTPQYHFSPDVMAYARIATGYRPGGPNPTCSAFGVPCHFGADRTKNYDLGLKADFMDHLISVDASVFYIDWKNIQLESQASCGCDADIFVNAGGAKSQGIELSSQIRPTKYLTINGWVDWTDAVLTYAFPPGSVVSANPGDPLPYASKFSANLSVQQDFQVTEQTRLFVSASGSYVGNRIGAFSDSEADRPVYPAYGEGDLHVGTLYRDWRIALGATNVTDRRGALRSEGPRGFVVTQPRTLTLSLTKTF